jgi:hypothetical protein
LLKTSDASKRDRQCPTDTAALHHSIEADSLEHTVDDLRDRLGNEVADQQDERECDQLRNEGGHRRPRVP